MKPQSLTTRDRIRAAQERALEAIKLDREKEGRDLSTWETFGGPVLNEVEVEQRYDQMLANMIGKQ